jgi:hypothetical protein
MLSKSTSPILEASVLVIFIDAISVLINFYVSDK